MSENRKPDSAAEVLAHLTRFVEDPEEVFSMSREEVRSALAAEGIDLQAKSRELQKRLAEIRGQQRLARAAEGRRQYQDRSGTGPLPAGQLSRAEMIRRLNQLDSRRTQAYFRNLEEATDQDLEQLLRDYEQLEEFHDEPGAEPRT